MNNDLRCFTRSQLLQLPVQRDVRRVHFSISTYQRCCSRAGVLQGLAARGHVNQPVPATSAGAQAERLGLWHVGQPAPAASVCWVNTTAEFTLFCGITNKHCKTDCAPGYAQGPCTPKLLQTSHIYTHVSGYIHVDKICFTGIIHTSN